MNTMDDLINEIGTLKPMPQIVTQVLSIAETPGSSLKEISDIIIYDPAMTANILKLSNSSYYSLPQKVDSLQDAITLLGMEKIIEIILLKSGAENMRNAQKGYGLEEGELWRYAVSSALIAKFIAEKKEVANPQIIFTAALLKDIGKIILHRFVNDKYEEIGRLVEQSGYSFREAEKKVIGIDHAELGGIIAKQWGFSQKMIQMIRHHHLNHEEARKIPEIQVLYAADNICMMMGIGVGLDGLAYHFHKEVMEDLKISAEDLQHIIATFAAEMKNVEDLIQKSALEN